jgi:hypothetical protein
VEVGEDLSYSLFSLPERISSTVTAQMPTVVPQVLSTKPSGTPTAIAGSIISKPPIASNGAFLSSALEGKITYWVPEEAGYGYLLAQDNQTYYLHFNAISDDRLRGILNSIPQRTRYPLQESIEFEPGTKSRPSDNYPPAKNVRLATGKPFAP